MPVSSYAAEMLLLYIEASRKPIVIKLGDKRKATILRQRLHNLRRDMRKEHHSQANIANGVTISITHEGDLHAFPADTAHLDALRRAGIGTSISPFQQHVSSLNSPNANHTPSVAADEGAGVQDVLQQFFSTSNPSTSTQKEP